ncbi:enoyl-CoA hydratase/isomerase family protein [Pseudomonas citronellolis]|uniref:enoyl-CoA hydratase/isomerase family protein n=1 Tax=Pseudomonas citronellolis TaxID=53408 RepID=UPI0021BF0090|nr:enoyl-CoA hydratase/isomerase family protein [Pseudomonas citronellolis]UXJ50176.1 enoyl-CoA hydratase/isomerase family protein [Pseudomonas citronellolis]
MTEARVEYIQEAQGRIAVLRMAAPPVNAFSLQLRRELLGALRRAGADDSVAVVVLAGAGRGFSAGGDIREFGTPNASAEPGLSSHIHVAIEGMGKPVIAVAHGFALGGGLETLLACHYRIAESDTRLGLPEVRLGTLPLSATQRLPRLLGILPALRMMVDGLQRGAQELADGPMFDCVVAAGCGLDAARQLAVQLIANPPGPAALTQRLVRNRPWPEVDLQRALIDAELWLALRKPDTVAQAVFQAIEAGVRCGHFEEGLAFARAIFDALMADERIPQERDRFLASASDSAAETDNSD